MSKREDASGEAGVEGAVIVKEELERKLHIMRAIRVFAADAVEVRSPDDVTYWEGVRDGLTLAMAAITPLMERHQDELGGRDEDG